MSNKNIYIAGPCVIESQELLNTVAEELVRLNKKYGIDIIFKASFDKANRTSLKSFRGPGITKGLAMLQEIKINTVYDYSPTSMKAIKQKLLAK